MNFLLFKALAGALGLVERALAQGQGGNPTVSLTNPLGTDSFLVVVGKVVNFLIEVSIPIVSIMVLIGGLQIMFAGGNEESFKKGKQTILYAVIGFAVVLLANGVVYIIKDLLGAQ